MSLLSEIKIAIIAWLRRLPLAVRIGKKRSIIGFDIQSNTDRALQAGPRPARWKWTTQS